MDNPGIYLVAWLLIAPIVGVVILSGLGGRSNRTETTTRHSNL
jgi:hypothetical protein